MTHRFTILGPAGRATIVGLTVVDGLVAEQQTLQQGAYCVYDFVGRRGTRATIEQVEELCGSRLGIRRWLSKVG